MLKKIIRKFSRKITAAALIAVLGVSSSISSYADEYGIMPIASTGGATIQNTATIVGENGDETDISSQSANTLITAAVLSIKRELLTTDIRPGDDITYKYTITNTGDAEGRNVQVNDVFDTSKFTFVSATQDEEKGISYNLNPQAYQNTIDWTIVTVEPDTSVEIFLVLNVNKSTSVGPIEPTVPSIDRENDKDVNIKPDPDAPGGENQGDIQIVAPVLAINKEVDGASARSGDVLTYTITVNNSGDGTARNVVVKDVVETSLVTIVPDSLTKSDNISCSEENGTVEWTITKIDPSETITLNLSVTIN